MSSPHLRVSIAAGRFSVWAILLFWLVFSVGLFEGGRIGQGRVSAILGAVYALTLAFLAVFLSGFADVGKRQRSKVLVFSSWLAAFSILLIGVFAAVMGMTGMGSSDPRYWAVGLFWSASTAAFGLGLLQLSKKYGALALWAGWLELISAALALPSEFGVAILLFLPGFILKRKLLRRAAEEPESSPA